MPERSEDDGLERRRALEKEYDAWWERSGQDVPGLDHTDGLRVWLAAHGIELP